MDKVDMVKFLFNARNDIWTGLASLKTLRMRRSLWQFAFEGKYKAMAEFLEDTGETIGGNPESEKQIKGLFNELCRELFYGEKKWDPKQIFFNKYHVFEDIYSDGDYGFTLGVCRSYKGAIKEVINWTKASSRENEHDKEPILEFRLFDFLCRLSSWLRLKENSQPSEVGPKSWYLGKHVRNGGGEYPVILSLLKVQDMVDDKLDVLPDIFSKCRSRPLLVKFIQDQRKDVVRLFRDLKFAGKDETILIVPCATSGIYDDVRNCGGYVFEVGQLIGVHPITERFDAMSSLNILISDERKKRPIGKDDEHARAVGEKVLIGGKKGREERTNDKYKTESYYKEFKKIDDDPKYKNLSRTKKCEKAAKGFMNESTKKLISGRTINRAVKRWEAEHPKKEEKKQGMDRRM